MIHAVIFDCFGVLVGQGFDETYHRAGGDPVKDSDFIRDLLGAANLGIISHAEMSERVCAQLQITPDVWRAAVAASEKPDEQLLAYAKRLSQTYKVAILSNANVGTLDRKFNKDQLAIFDAVVVSAEVGLIKPDAAIYELVAERLGVSPDECVFTDDSSAYCLGAQSTGMHTVQYSHFLQFKQDLERLLDHS